MVGKLRGGLLFQSVYDGLDAALHTGSYAAGHGVRRRWRGTGGGLLRGRVRDQAFLIAQLVKREKERRKQKERIEREREIPNRRLVL